MYRYLCSGKAKFVKERFFKHSLPPIALLSVRMPALAFDDKQLKRAAYILALKEIIRPEENVFFQPNTVVPREEVDFGTWGEVTKENVADGNSKNTLSDLLYPWGDGHYDAAVVTSPSGLKELFEVELCRQKSKGNSKSVSSSIRSEVVDWLIDLGSDLDVYGGAIFLAVYYMDAFLGSEKVSRVGTRCVATAALGVASRLEGVNDGWEPLTAEELESLHDCCVVKSCFIGLQRTVFWRLFQKDAIRFATSRAFLSCFMEELEFPRHVVEFAECLLELGLVEGGEILDFLPSVQASSALALAAHSGVEGDAWKENFVKITTYALLHLLPCMTVTKSIWSKGSKGAVNKYFLSNDGQSNVVKITVRATFPQ